MAKLKHNSLASNILLAGTTVQCGTGKAIIINVGKNSAIGKIQEKLIAGEEESTPL
jgi:magnesium-transporting ATPase (P-type)